MDLISLVIGIAVGAAFAPMWMKLWNMFASVPQVQALIDAAKNAGKPKE